MRNPTGRYNGNELKYVSKVLQSDKRSATEGSWNKRLETLFAERFGVRYAIAHNSGTSALHSCLAAAGVGPGDEVISPALTVIMNTFATLYQNAVPVYADIDPETFNIAPEDIERKITPRTRAIFAVSLYGLPADMERIMDIAEKYNLIVIEDNAECFLGYCNGRLAGSIGHMSIFSFENSKHISVGEGGIAITNDEKLAQRIRKCAGIGYKNLRAEEGRVKLNEETFQDPDYKRHDTLGWNYRMSEICAAVAVGQLEKLNKIVADRQEVAKYYQQAIDGCNWLIPQKIPDGYVHSYWAYTVRYEGEKTLGVSWKEFYRAYKQMGGDGFYAAWSVPYFEPVIADGGFCVKGSHYTGPKFSYKKGFCPAAESIQPKLMQLKTNYRDLELAKTKAQALRKTIQTLESKKRERQECLI